MNSDLLSSLPTLKMSIDEKRNSSNNSFIQALHVNNWQKVEI